MILRWEIMILFLQTNFSYIIDEAASSSCVKRKMIVRQSSHRKNNLTKEEIEKIINKEDSDKSFSDFTNSDSEW